MFADLQKNWEDKDWSVVEYRNNLWKFPLWWKYLLFNRFFDDVANRAGCFNHATLKIFSRNFDLAGWAIISEYIDCFSWCLYRISLWFRRSYDAWKTFSLLSMFLISTLCCGVVIERFGKGFDDIYIWM